MHTKTRHRTAARRVRGVLLTFAMLLAVWGCGGERDSAPTAADASPAASNGFLNTSLDVAYVGEAECRECHLGIATTYRETGMGRAFHPLTAETVVEDFTDNNEFVAAKTGVRYRMFERGGRYWQRQYVLDSHGQELAAEERELIWVVGSNNHSRSYITMIGEKMFQAPVCWYPDVSRWDFCPGYQIGNEHFSREVGVTCLTCHNGRMEPVDGVRNAFHRPFPQGIGCERCHGPGALHVERWSGGEQASGQVDPTIVNPRRLTGRERLDVCAQCHLGDARATTNVGRYGKELQDFRPGLLLADFQIAYHYEQDTLWDYGLSSQVDRMVQSACYTESGGKLDCMTCHNPHISVYHDERAPDYFRKRCLGCHQLDACTAPLETRSATTPQDNCVTCHMRTAEPDDQKYTTMTDHWIRRDIDHAERDHRTDYTIEPMFPEDLTRLAAGERHYYNARGAFLLAMDAPRSRYDEMWAVAEKEFLAAIDAGYENEAVWFFLGKTWGFQQRAADARNAFRKALEFDPEHHDANFALGHSLMQKGDVPGAMATYKAMVERDPTDAMALSEYGRSLFAMQRMDQAYDALSRALELEPWNPTLQVNFGMSTAALGRMDDAAGAGTRAVSLNPELEDAWTLYFNAMRESGRLNQADEGHRWLVRSQQLKQLQEQSDAPSSAPRMGLD